MAFDNVTLFEVNLPNEVFSRASGREEASTDAAAKADESAEAESGGRSKGRLLLVALVLAGVAVGVRKLRSGGEDGEIEMAYEEPGVEVEQPEP